LIFLHEANGSATIGREGVAVRQVGGAVDVMKLNVGTGGHELVDELLNSAVLEA